MSRYLLIPKFKRNDKSNIETFSLVPAEGFNGQVKEVDLPLNIVPKQKYKNNQQKKSFEIFMQKLDRVNIRRNKDGLLNIGNKVTDINFDDFVKDCCERKFSVCYEGVYCSLRENGITF